VSAHLRRNYPVIRLKGEKSAKEEVLLHWGGSGWGSGRGRGDPTTKIGERGKTITIPIQRKGLRGEQESGEIRGGGEYVSNFNAKKKRLPHQPEPKRFQGERGVTPPLFLRQPRQKEGSFLHLTNRECRRKELFGKKKEKGNSISLGGELGEGIFPR